MYVFKDVGLGAGGTMVLVPGAIQSATQTPVAPGTTATSYPVPSTPFYMTWWGIGLIAIAAYLGYKKFIKK